MRLAVFHQPGLWFSRRDSPWGPHLLFVFKVRTLAGGRYYVHRINRDMLCFDTVSVPVSLELDLLCNKVVKYHTEV